MDGLETEVRSWSGVIFSKIWSPLAPHCYNCADLWVCRWTDRCSKKNLDLFPLESVVYLWGCLSFKVFTLSGSQQPGSTLLLCWDSNKNQAHKHPLESAVPHVCDGPLLFVLSVLHISTPAVFMNLTSLTILPLASSTWGFCPYSLKNVSPYLLALSLSGLWWWVFAQRLGFHALPSWAINST